MTSCSSTSEKKFCKFYFNLRKVIEGYVSTEIDARLSYDIEASVSKARRIIKLYEEEGVSKDRILIKIVATWEGIKAAEMYY